MSATERPLTPPSAGQVWDHHGNLLHLTHRAVIHGPFPGQFTPGWFHVWLNRGPDDEAEGWVHEEGLMMDGTYTGRNA